MVTSGSVVARWLGFGFALAAAFATTAVLETPGAALVWLPSGVAITGLVLLGWRAASIVAIAALSYRLLTGTPLQFAIVGSLASSTEALLGYWLLRTLRIRQGCARLYDVVAIYVMALVAPLGSMLVIVFGRLSLAGPQAQTPLVGMASWWRMNAIAILITVPLVVSWPVLARLRDHLRPLGRAMAWGGTAVVLALTVMLVARPSLSSVFLLGILPLIALAAALDMGNRGSSTVCFLSVVCIALPASCGIGVFEAIDTAERHIVTQILLVGIAGLSPLFGALLAERDANASRLLQNDAVGNALLRLLPDASYRLSPDGYVLDAVLPKDPALPDAEELIGKHIRDITPPDLAERLLQQLRLLHEGKSTQTTEYTVDSPIGRRDREVRFVMLPNGEAMSVARDITERKRAERQLALQASILEMIATGARRNAVFEALVTGLEAILPDGQCSILLRQRDKLHLACAPTMDPEYNRAIDGLEVAVNNGACGTAAATGEIVIVPDCYDDPRLTPYVDLLKRFSLRACWSVPVRSTDDKVLGTLAIYHDHVREPEQFEIDAVERAAVLVGLTIDRERREALLASINKNVNEGLFRCIPGEDFVYVNPSFARMLGYESPEEMLTQWRQATHLDHLNALEQLCSETLSIHSKKAELRRRDGTAFWALISTSVTFDDDDTELLCDGSVTDITSHKELEDQLRQAQKMEAVGQLAGGVAHDFNNLLTAINGFSETIEDQLPIGSHIEVVIAPQPEPVRAKADRGQLEQVILNLVINARDALPKGGKVTIIADTVELPEGNAQPDLPAGTYAVLRVRDNGTGMTPEVQGRAFDPFFTTKAPGVGTGLGLSTVYGIVKQSHGDIVIDSTIGAGTTMSVYLPFANELPVPERAVIVPRQTPKRGTILVAEDERIVLELTERALVAAGHKVLTASDGLEALQMFSEHHDTIDLVVTDIVMPSMGGPELAAELQASNPDLRVLFMSGYAPDSIDLPPDNLSTAFLDKPFSTGQLIERVDLLLNRDSTGPAPQPADRQ